MHELEKAMLNVLDKQSLNGKVSEIAAISKIIKAAELLTEAGFENEAKVVLSMVKESGGLKKQASAIEEDLFDISMDIDLETIKNL